MDLIDLDNVITPLDFCIDSTGLYSSKKEVRFIFDKLVWLYRKGYELKNCKEIYYTDVLDTFLGHDYNLNSVKEEELQSAIKNLLLISEVKIGYDSLLKEKEER